MLGEELEQLEFLEGEVEHAAAQPGRVGCLVDGQFARADLIRRIGDRGGGAAADGQPDPGLYLGGAGCVQDHVVGAPLGAHRRETALGHDREERAIQARRLQQAADALGVHELAAGVYQHGIGGWRLYQGGRVRGQHADRVQQESEGRQHLGGRLEHAGDQQQVAHSAAPPLPDCLYKTDKDPGATAPGSV